ncbi:MAG TPA: hypothetical protein VK788_23145 [Terriglobales bacterium]|jgi:hypothetical protein|nr:hypothetical protein [Terriglobales bacterium]
MKRIVISILFPCILATATPAADQSFAGTVVQAVRQIATDGSPTAPPLEILVGNDLFVTVTWVGLSLGDIDGVLDNPKGSRLKQESGLCVAQDVMCISRFRITETSSGTRRATLLINTKATYYFMYVKEEMGLPITY